MQASQRGVAAQTRFNFRHVVFALALRSKMHFCCPSSSLPSCPCCAFGPYRCCPCPSFPWLGQRMSKVRRVNKGGITGALTQSDQSQTSLGLRWQLDTLNVSTASLFWTLSFAYRQEQDLTIAAFPKPKEFAKRICIMGYKHSGGGKVKHWI